jgi:hypothetical protein
LPSNSTSCIRKKSPSHDLLPLKVAAQLNTINIWLIFSIDWVCEAFQLTNPYTLLMVGVIIGLREEKGSFSIPRV